MKTMKKLAAAILSLSLAVCALPVQAYADDISETVIGDVASPYYLYTNSASSVAYKSGSTVTGDSRLNGNSSVTKITGNEFLCIKAIGWIPLIPLASDSVNSNKITLTGSTSTANLNSGTYRISASFTVYSGSNSETVSVYSNEIVI